MNDIQIKSFMVAAKYQNFTKASEHLFITQSVLSRHIAALEQELGVLLFHRIRNAVQLTDAGAMFAEDIGKLSVLYEESIKRLSRFKEESKAYLRFGMLEGQFIGEVIRKVFMKMWTDPSKVTVQITYLSLKHLETSLIEGDVDIIITSEDLVESFSKEINTRLVREGKSCLVTSIDHPLADKENLSLADFRDDVFITLDPQEYPMMSRLHMDVSAKRGFPDKRIVAPNFETLMLWIGNNVGISTMVPWHPLHENPIYRFLEVPELNMIREVAAWQKNNTNKYINTFLKAMDVLP
jgi:DNA-binding transcriptional LysR family regulator